MTRENTIAFVGFVTGFCLATGILDLAIEHPVLGMINMTLAVINALNLYNLLKNPPKA